MQTLQVEEVVKVSTSEFIDEVTKSFSKFSNANIIDKHPAIFVAGQPGIGKSQSIIQIKDNLESATGKKVYITDVRLLLFNPIDLRGIPVADKNREKAIWLRPEIFELDDSNETINIFFLDELTAAPTSLQAAAYQIALDKTLGEHKLPNNTFVIAAGNRTNDYSVAYEMPSALKNRFMHFEIENNFEDWYNWAIKNNIHEEILMFLRDNPDKLSTKKFDVDSNIIVTPRSWEFLSNVLKTIGGGVSDNQNIVASIIGNTLTYLLIHENTNEITVEDICNGKIKNPPNDISELQRITDILESQIDTYIHEIDKTTNVLKFLNVIPIDYGIMIFRKIARYSGLSYEVSKVKAFNTYITKIGDLNDNK